MPCNYLFKAEGDNEYAHYLMKGCNSSVALGAIVNYFVKRNPEVKVSKWDELKGTFPLFYYHLYQEGPGVFREKFEIFIGPIRTVKDPSQPFTPDNFLERIGFRARSIEVECLGVVPWLRKFMDME